MDKRTETPETEALSRMQLDPDIQEETRSLASVGAGLSQARAADTAAPTSTAILPLNVSSGAHRPSRGTVALATRAGGLNKFREMTTKFYQKAFLDPQLDPFIRSHDDPHGERFASWIAEKMGLGKPWTEERQTRAVCPFAAKGHSFDTPHDRSRGSHSDGQGIVAVASPARDLVRHNHSGRPVAHRSCSAPARDPVGLRHSRRCAR